MTLDLKFLYVAGAGNGKGSRKNYSNDASISYTDILTAIVVLVHVAHHTVFDIQRRLRGRISLISKDCSVSHIAAIFNCD